MLAAPQRYAHLGILQWSILQSTRRFRQCQQSELDGPGAAIQELDPNRRSASCRHWLAADWLMPQTSAPWLTLRVRAMSRKSLRCSSVILRIYYKPGL